MQSPYERLVAELGEDGAKAYMRALRSKVKNPGFASMNKEKLKAISSKGGKARRTQKVNNEDN